MSFIEGVPTVMIDLDKPRELGYTVAAIARIQAIVGAAADLTLQKTQVEMLPKLVWACLSAEGRRELSIEQIEDMIHLGNVGPIGAAIGVLHAASNPEDAEGNGVKGPRKKAARAELISASSGPSASTTSG
jgi:hypothetical protein